MKTWAFLLLLTTTTASAEIGSVTDITGVAVIKRGSNTINVAKGTFIETNDKVETKNGVVKITFKDDTTVKVTESSSLVIDDFVYDPKSSAGKLGMKTTSGTVRYVSGNIAHNNPNSVNIKTPTAAIAVRGTDFVMSVDEAGKSAVILMPSCDDNCESGKIDVDSGGKIVHMDQAYQATMIETEETAPLPPIVIDLAGAPIGNNILLTGLKTPGGVMLQTAARSADKTTDAKKKDDGAKDEKDPGTNETVAASSKNSSEESSKNDTQGKLVGAVDANSLKAAGIKVKDSTTGDPDVYIIYKDASHTQQTGWGYESLSENGHNYTNVVLNLDTTSVIVVTQDRLTDAYNYSSNGRSSGSIVISQTFK